MNLIKFSSVLTTSLVLMVAVSACKKRPGVVTPLPKSGIAGTPSEMPPAPPFGDTNISGTPVPITDPSQFDRYNHDADMFKSDMIFFAYDSSVIRSGEKSKLGHVADYLKAHPDNALEVDGHCDERGTEEYNRALGERRALAGREELARMGVDPTKIVTKTFGKDRPIEPLHSEAAWSKNRRDEFILLTPPK